MATRIYLPSSGAATVTPGAWLHANQINPLTFAGVTAKINSTMTTKLEATGTTSPIVKAMLRYVIGPLSDTEISGTVKIQMRALESNTGANATLSLAVHIVQPDGSARATLLGVSAADVASNPYEFSAADLTNRRAYTSGEVQPMDLSAQTPTAGDYLVIEIGFRSATTTTRNISLRYGDTTVADLEDNTTSTNDYAPYVEFSGDLVFDIDYAPTVTTEAVTAITEETATGNGTVTDDGGATVTERGVAWGTSANPTIAGDHAAAAAGGTGVFTASMTGLTPGTLYHVRAYATNSVDTSYGADVTFTAPAYPADTLTLATDAFGRVTITPANTGASYALQKSLDGSTWVDVFTTAVLAELVDNRPQFNWKTVDISGVGADKTFSFTGVALAVYNDPVATYYESPYAATLTLDSVSKDIAVQNEPHASDLRPYDLVWGINGLNNEQHDVTLDFYCAANAEYKYTDFWADYGATIYYRVVIDDGLFIEDGTIAPVNTTADVITAFKDRFLAQSMFDTDAYDLSVGMYTSIGALAGAYWMTEDSDLLVVADSIMDYFDANYSWPAPPVNYTDGRLINNFMSAYKQFVADDPTLANRFLDAADQMCGLFRNGTLYTYGSLDNVLVSSETSATFNQWVFPLYGMALCWNEPESDYYHDALVEEIVLNSMTHLQNLGMINETTGEMPYASSISVTPDLSYAIITWPGVKYISDTMGWDTTNTDLATGWIAASFPNTEPHFYRSLYYGGQHPGYIALKICAYYFANNDVPPEMIHMIYSAAFDGTSNEDGTTYEYRPEGWPQSDFVGYEMPHPDSLWIFWGANYYYWLGVPPDITPPPFLEVTGSGGAVAGGSAIIAGVKTYSIAGTGGTVAGGTAGIATVKTYAITGSGGAVAGGSADIETSGGQIVVAGGSIWPWFEIAYYRKRQADEEAEKKREHERIEEAAAEMAREEASIIRARAAVEIKREEHRTAKAIARERAEIEALELDIERLQAEMNRTYREEMARRREQELLDVIFIMLMEV